MRDELFKMDKCARVEEGRHESRYDGKSRGRVRTEAILRIEAILTQL